MSDNLKNQQSGIKDLIAKGREQGYLTYAEVNDHLPEGIADPEQVEDIIQMINDMGITVFETAPDAESRPARASALSHSHLLSDLCHPGQSQGTYPQATEPALLRQDEYRMP